MNIPEKIGEEIRGILQEIREQQILNQYEEQVIFNVLGNRGYSKDPAAQPYFEKRIDMLFYLQKQGLFTIEKNANVATVFLLLSGDLRDDRYLLTINKERFDKYYLEMIGSANRTPQNIKSIEDEHNIKTSDTSQTPIQEFNNLVYTMLKKIKEDLLYFGELYNGNKVGYSFMDKERLSDNWIKEEMVLFQLKKLGILSDLEQDKGYDYKFKVIEKQFNELLTLYENKSGFLDYENGGIVIKNVLGNTNSSIVSLRDIKITFELEKDNPSNGWLIVGEQKKLYISDTFKYHVCKYMFLNKRITVGRPYPWDLIYSSYDSKIDITVEIDKKQSSIRNAVYGINEDVQKILGTKEELLTYSNRSVIRNP